MDGLFDTKSVGSARLQFIVGLAVLALGYAGLLLALRAWVL